MSKIKIVEMDKSLFSTFSKNADEEYILTRLFAYGGLYSKAGFFGHEVCEKYLKALSVQAKGNYLTTHKLSDLSDHCADVMPELKDTQTIETLSNFDNFDQVGRYGAAASYDPLAREFPCGVVKGAMQFKPDYISLLDKFVYEIRSRLDFTEYPGMDFLRAILFRDNTNLLVMRTERFRPRFRTILTRDNLFYPN